MLKLIKQGKRIINVDETWIAGVKFMPITDPDAANYWLTCLTIDPHCCGTSREAIIKALDGANIEARPLWKPLHMQAVFKDKVFYGHKLAENLYEHGFCLPSGSSMSEKERQRVIQVVKDNLEMSTH